MLRNNSFIQSTDAHFQCRGDPGCCTSCNFLITDEVSMPIELQQPSRVGSFYVIVENDGTVTMSH